MCCGRRVAADRSATGSSPSGWKVTYPDGKVISYESESKARIAAALVPGAKYERVSS